MNSLPKGILFDLDDTIIPLDASAGKLWEEVCEEFAPKIGGADYEPLLSTINKTRKWYWQDAERRKTGDYGLARREIVRKVFADLGLRAFDCADTLADTFTERRMDQVDFFPHSERILLKCQKKYP